MKRVLVCFLFSLIPVLAFGGVGDSDNRYYVTDEMWATEPYNRFVYFEVMAENGKGLVPSGHCSAQYVSPNLILSAGHCTSKDADGYRVKNYKQQEFLVELIETPYDGKMGTIGDWAVWLVTDPLYYSDAYFDLKTPKKTMQILNAGWGWARIIGDEELQQIRGTFEHIQEELESKTNISKVIVWLDIRLKRIGIERLYESPTKFKASTCNIVLEDCAEMKLGIDDGLDETQNMSDKQLIKWFDNVHKKEEKFANVCNNQTNLIHWDVFPNILATTCDSWGGNSGGGYVSTDGKYLYGICSFGMDSFTDSDNTDFITSALQFEKRLKELIKIYSSKNPVAENIAKIPKNIFEEETTDQGDETGETVEEQKMLRRMDNRIQRLTQETEVLDKNLISALPDVSKMSDEQLLSFLDKMVEYKVKNSRLEELKQAYQEAKAREQSTANKVLGGVTMAATGIGGMELARGLAEQNADAAADTDMTAYIATMRCTYGDGKNVPAGQTEIELPGGNDENLTALRSEYFALASDLRERKAALEMPAGIESQEITDVANTGLYDNAGVGTTDGAYASLYRAKMQNSETDQARIDADKKASKNRVTAGGVLTGVGVVGGAVGNAVINGKLGEKIKENKNQRSVSRANKSVIDKLKKGLKSSGMTNVDKLDFSKLDLSGMSGVIDKIDFSSMSNLRGRDATEIFNTSNSTDFSSSLGNVLGTQNATLFN